MSPKTLSNFSVLVTCLVLFAFAAKAEIKETGEIISVSLQKRIPSELDEGAFIIVNEIQEWNANETAIKGKGSPDRSCTKRLHGILQGPPGKKIRGKVQIQER
jgi:hypothetical protein